MERYLCRVAMTDAEFRGKTRGALGRLEGRADKGDARRHAWTKSVALLFLSTGFGAAVGVIVTQLVGSWPR